MVPMRIETTDASLAQELKLIAGLKMKIGEPLARYTSIKIGGPADYFLEVEERTALRRALGLFDRYAVSFQILGNGSNVLVSDLGVRGVVLRLAGEFKRIDWREEGEKVVVTVGAAFPVAQLVWEGARRGYSGLEFAEGIPGSVGGALVMNAGAYGSEMEKVIAAVEAVTPKGETLRLSRKEMDFSYRDSHLPAGTIVTQVSMRLEKGVSEEVSQRVRGLVAKRKESQPSGQHNLGSMFRNPPGDFAGRLIEAAGLKGKRVGRAEISKKHANFIVNLGGAKAAEVNDLMDIARTEVKKNFGIVLEPEIRFLGEWHNR